MLTIQNKYIIAEIDTLGAKLNKLSTPSGELVKESAPGSALGGFTFPFFGRMFNSAYTFGGETYPAALHGFLKEKEFEVLEQTVASVTLGFASDDETLAVYPFMFSISVKYTVADKGLIVSFKVKNRTGGDMYFSYGAHPAFTLENGLEDVEIRFPFKEALTAPILKEGLLTEDSVPVLRYSDILPVYKRYFNNDSLILTDLRSRSLEIYDRLSGRRIGLEFPGISSLCIWAPESGEYLCVEPIAAMPGTYGETEDITEKPGICRIAKHRTATFSYKIKALPIAEVPKIYISRHSKKRCKQQADFANSNEIQDANFGDFSTENAENSAPETPQNNAPETPKNSGAEMPTFIID